MSSTFEKQFFRDAKHISQPTDPLLHLFLRLHVASDCSSEFDFRRNAAASLRKSNLYKSKQLMLPQEAVEESLVTGPLTAFGFYALCLLYNVKVNYRVGPCFFQTGASEFWVVDGALKRMVGDASLVQVNPCKPLNAVSYYTAADLQAMCLKFGLPVTGKKAELYDAALSFTAKLFT